MSSPTRVVLVCPNDLVTDTRGQKMAASLARLGMDVSVVARASERAPETETIDGVPVVRVPVPAVPNARAAAPLPSQTLVAEAKELRGAASRTWRAATGGGTSPRRRARGAVRAAQLRGKAALKSLELRRARAAERGAPDPWAGIGARDAYPGWRDLLTLQVAMDEAFWPVIESLDPDVIQCHDLDGLVAAGLAHRRLTEAGREVRLVYDAHENWAGLPDFDWRREVHNSFLGVEAEFVPACGLVMTVSDEIADTIRARYSLAVRPTLMLNTPSVRLAEPAPRTLRDVAGLDDSTPVMVYSGSISHARRVPDLIAALPLLPDVHLVIVSVPFPHRLGPEFEEQARALGVDDRMHIVPPVTGRQVVSYLSTASVGVHPLLPGAPNHEMALPNKLFEYLHAGIPVVVSNCRAMTAFVHEVDLGREFEHGSAESLATAVRTVLDGRARGGFTPSPETVARFTWEAQEPDLGTAYATMLARP